MVMRWVLIKGYGVGAGQVGPISILIPIGTDFADFKQVRVFFFAGPRINS